MSTVAGRRSLTQETRELLARHPDLALEYVQHRRTGKVHVLVPPDPDVPATSIRDRFEWLGWLRENRPTVCGYQARILLGAGTEGDQLVSMFADHTLCGGCLNLLGPHRVRAFDRPEPDGTPDDA